MVKDGNCKSCVAIRGDCGRHNPAARHEPPPMANSNVAIQDLVIEDMRARKEVGLKKYGTALQGFNGRDALMDAYQEALDLVNYLRQMIYERDNDASRT